MSPDFKKKPRVTYNPAYCDDLLKYMAKGYSNLEVIAKIGIAEKTFYEWIKSEPDFKEAYDIGDPVRFSFLMQKADQLFLEGGNDKGYKHWLKKVSYMYKNYAPESVMPSGTTNNIQISNMNVLQSISNDKGKLLDYINAKLLSTNLIEHKKDPLNDQESSDNGSE